MANSKLSKTFKLKLLACRSEELAKAWHGEGVPPKLSRTNLQMKFDLADMFDDEDVWEVSCSLLTNCLRRLFSAGRGRLFCVGRGVFGDIFMAYIADAACFGRGLGPYFHFLCVPLWELVMSLCRVAAVVCFLCCWVFFWR